MKQPKITPENSVTDLQREVMCIPKARSTFCVTRTLVVFFSSGNVSGETGIQVLDMISKITFFQSTCLFFHVSLDSDLVGMGRHKTLHFKAIFIIMNKILWQRFTAAVSSLQRIVVIKIQNPPFAAEKATSESRALQVTWLIGHLYEVWQKTDWLKLEESPKYFHETALCSLLAGTSTSSLQIAFELLYQ